MIRKIRKTTMAMKNRMRAPRQRRCHAAEAEYTCHQCNDRKDERPSEQRHFILLKLDGRLSGMPTRPNAPRTRGLLFPFRSEHEGEPALPSRASPKARNDAEQIVSGERLADQGSTLVLRRQLLSPITAHKGKWNAAGKKRIGNAADRLAAKIGIE
jgi:hypothetical protein